jgi:Protein of unknown function (DUF4232)
MRVRLGTAMIGITVLAVTSCSSHAGSGSASTTASTATNTPRSAGPTVSAGTSASTPSVSAETSPAVSSLPATIVGRCRTSVLRLSQGRVDGTAGSSYATYYLRNGGTVTCTLTGFPGFSLLDSHGAIIQRPAGRTGAHYSTVALRAGDRAEFVVRTVDPSIPGTGCSLAWRTAQVQVYPPNETSPLRQASTLQACDVTVGPVQTAH